MNDGRKAGDIAAQTATTAIRLPPIGFWSYSRQDDELSKARLSNLRSLLMAEIQQQYGRDRVQLFQDVSAIPHGAEWEREIRTSLGNSTFFIPIVTPNFLQSEWCCREVMIFFEREEQLFETYPDLPRRRRIFPLQLIDIEGIEPADGRVLEGLKKLQWFDFRELRHSSHDHESVHRALSRFAVSIRDLLQVKVRPPAAEEIEREAAAAAERAREEEAAAVALQLAQEEEHRRREAEEAEALHAAEAEARAEAERQAQAARIEADRAAEPQPSANAEADWAEWDTGEDFATAPGEGGLLERWRSVPAAHRIAFGATLVLVLVIGIVVLLASGGREETNPAFEMSSEPPMAMADAGPATPSPPLATAAPAGPSLADQIATAATELNQRTPMTVDPITTLTGVRSEGTEIIYEMRISQDIPSAQMEAIRQTAQTANQTNLCADPNAGRLIRMGASMSHYYTDPSGDRFETHITACPPA